MKAFAYIISRNFTPEEGIYYRTMTQNSRHKLPKVPEIKRPEADYASFIRRAGANGDSTTGRFSILIFLASVHAPQTHEFCFCFHLWIRRPCPNRIAFASCVIPGGAGLMVFANAYARCTASRRWIVSNQRLRFGKSSRFWPC